MTKKTKHEELVERFKNTPIGEMEVADIVAFCGEDELLDEISEYSIAQAISPSDYAFHYSKLDLLESFSDEELLDECDYDEIMSYAQRYGDARQWLDTHPSGNKRSVSMEEATIPLIRTVMEVVRPYSASFLTKKEDTSAQSVTTPFNVFSVFI